MSTSNIFENDWRDCLRSHFAHVIREEDKRNETSLISVLIQTGYSEAELDAMRQQILIDLGWFDPAELEEPSTQVEAEPVEQLEQVEAVDTVELVELDTVSEPALEEPASVDLTMEQAALAELRADTLAEPEAAAQSAPTDQLEQPEQSEQPDALEVMAGEPSTTAKSKPKPPEEPPPVQMSLF